MCENCEKCKFGAAIVPDKMFDLQTSETFVLCHRYPPQPVVPINKKGQFMWGWPLVGKKEWCGEYQERN